MRDVSAFSDEERAALSHAHNHGGLLRQDGGHMQGVSLERRGLCSYQQVSFDGGGWVLTPAGHDVAEAFELARQYKDLYE